MSEARAVTNFSGNAVATVLIGKWVGEFDKEKADRVLAGNDPFDESDMLDDDDEDAPTLGGGDESSARPNGAGGPPTSLDKQPSSA
jgi:aerobic C4-dicarboxylate transport protein